jgi:hypothetical protein
MKNTPTYRGIDDLASSLYFKKGEKPGNLTEPPAKESQPLKTDRYDQLPPNQRQSPQQQQQSAHRGNADETSATGRRLNISLGGRAPYHEDVALWKGDIVRLVVERHQKISPRRLHISGNRNLHIVYLYNQSRGFCLTGNERDGKKKKRAEQEQNFKYSKTT